MAEKKRVVVVGNGMVGHRFCEQLAQRDVDKTFHVTVFGEEKRPAYDRVHLTEFFSGKGPEQLAIADNDWYAAHGFKLHLGDRVAFIDRKRCEIITVSGHTEPYDHLVLATGSSPFVPPLDGIHQQGVFVYRTLDDLEAIHNSARQAKTAVVIGGGLLGLEAAKAVVDLGLQVHIVEYADRLMPRQVDASGGELLRSAISSLGVQVHLAARIDTLLDDGQGCVSGVRFADGETLNSDMVIVSTGIRPRDYLARTAGLSIGERGGIIVDDTLSSSDPSVYAIGENVLHRGMVYGLVAPGYDMAEVLARRLLGEDIRFEGGDLSTKLKLMGVDVASFGDYFADQERPEQAKSLVFQDNVSGVYQKLVISHDGKRLLGGILVGNADQYTVLHLTSKTGMAIPEQPQELLFGASGGGISVADFGDEVQVCSCNNISKGQIVQAIAEHELTSLSGVKACTKAGTGCGGCMPSVTQIFNHELAKSGREVDNTLCEHFPYTRKELFWIVKLNRIQHFNELLDSHGKGDGCEICRPAVASILAATWNDLIANHATIQDTNDRFLANIQRGGSYSVVPRVPGGEITPDKLIVLGEVAKKYDLYCKITGGQRIDLFGAQAGQLPDIWEELIQAGFESGHAYGKAMRTVKSCVGSSWCRYGVQDSVGFAIRLEERYRGIRAPHKFKSAVSGCIRECAEAQNKDFGIIATEQGWNVYLGGNGGSNPCHGHLVGQDMSDDEAIRLIDRYLMFYIQTAKPLQRTARWLEELDGGIDYLKGVIIDDSLGICAQLENDMQQLVDTYQCEWKAVVENPVLRASFTAAATASPDKQPALPFIRERGQKRPADWSSATPVTFLTTMPSDNHWQWQQLAAVDTVPQDGGLAVDYGEVQIALYHFARRGEWYATQNTCPHRKEALLARGMLGSQGDEPKVACPMHKKTFSLRSGEGLNDPDYRIRTFPVQIREEQVWVKLPPAALLAQELGRAGGQSCAA